MSSKVSLTFEIYQGDKLVRTETLTQSVVKIGKLASCHLRIEDDNVARLHAFIEASDSGEVLVTDLGSSSGTFVNDKKINKCNLQSGDEIKLGDTRVVVTIAPAAADAVVTSNSLPPGAPGGGSIPPAAPNPFAQPAGAALPNPFAAPVAAALPNPFAAPAAVQASSSVAPPADDPENVRYGIVASGPPVSSDEVETASEALEVVLMWGDSTVLTVAHLSPPRPFYVGESMGKGSPVDFLIGSDVLGTDRLPLVTVSGGAAVVIPKGATGDVTINNQTMTVQDLIASGKTQASSEAPGAQQYPLPKGATAKVSFNGFTYIVRPVQAGKKIAGSKLLFAASSLALLGWIVASFGVHGAFLLMMYFMPPRGAGLSLDLLNADSRMAKFLTDARETVEEEVPTLLEQNKNDDEGGKGKRHKDEEGQMGKNEAKKTKNRYGIQGPQDNEDPHMARDAAREQAKTAGILGVLRASTGAWNSPTSPYGRDTALGNDPTSALGALMGDQIGENFGFGGLGLRGTGRGGGGTGEGTIGLGSLGTIGHGAGGGSGNGYGRGAGGLGGRASSAPRIRQGTADVHGSLSKEVIKRVIQRHINEVRFCYEQQLAQRPDLGGRVTVSFIISPTGTVQSAVVSATTMNNAPTEGCIATAVRRWTFPAPEGGGIVAVNYPFVLEAAGGGE